MQSMTASELESLVASADRPVLVDFWAAWCRPCRLMDRVLADIGAELERKVDIVKVDVDGAASLARSLAIESVPTLVLYNAGRTVDTVSGVLPAAELRRWIDARI